MSRRAGLKLCALLLLLATAALGNAAVLPVPVVEPAPAAQPQHDSAAAAAAAVPVAEIESGQAFHPPVKLLNTEGQPVYSAGGAVSPMSTCGQCHDTLYIAQHSYHADAGQSELFTGETPGWARPWDFGPGLYGRWDPLTYTLPLAADELRRLDPAAWERALGFRHAGGGPGLALGAELNCFLCHTAQPDNTARIAEMQAGRFTWAATATLTGSGLAVRNGAGWGWNKALFASDGTVTATRLTLGEPASANCGACHGVAYEGEAPLALDYALHNWSTVTTGQVFSSQRVSASALNLREKERQVRPWDIHAERLLNCADCHYALNNPAFSREPGRTKPGHLRFDPRRLSLGQYLKTPRHGFAKGYSAQGLSAPESDGSMRRCGNCHNVLQTHSDWLPYARRHLRALSCEACHIPQLYAPARQATDWTMLTPQGGARLEYRGGAEGSLSAAQLLDPATLLAGYQPVLLPRRLPNGRQQLMPFNMITSWYWVGETPGGTPLPVDQAVLQAVFLPGGNYAAALLAALDADGDGVLSDAEQRLDTPQKVQAAQALLEQAGVAKPRIQGKLAPFDLHHGVATAQWAVKQCNECHARRSRLSAPLALGGAHPGGVMPVLSADKSVRLAGQVTAVAGELRYQPDNAAAGLYVLGHDRWLLGDRLGLIAVLLAVLAVLSHGLLRIGLALRGRKRGVR